MPEKLRNKTEVTERQEKNESIRLLSSNAREKHGIEIRRLSHGQ